MILSNAYMNTEYNLNYSIAIITKKYLTISDFLVSMKRSLQKVVNNNCKQRLYYLNRELILKIHYLG